MRLYFQKVLFINSNFWDGGLNSIKYHSSKISLTLPSRDAIYLFIFLILKKWDSLRNFYWIKIMTANSSDGDW